MRDAFNQFIPMVHNDFNGTLLQTGVPTVTHVPSNGYYGYQPVTEKQQTHAQESMDCQDNSEMDIQFNNYIEPEPEVACAIPRNQATRGNANKKRTWDFETTERGFKKRREEPLPNPPVLPAPTKHASLRCPTHNIPDMPHRIMGHFV